MFNVLDFQKRVLKPVTKIGSNDFRSLVEDRLRQASLDNKVDVAHVTARAAHD